SNIGVELTSTIGKVLDDLITSDEEVALTEVQKLKIKTTYDVEIKTLLAKLEQHQSEQERFSVSRHPSG
ncbi:MAG: hypothetical protein P8Y45_05770, partial [Exilibacterium sp.]